MKVALLKEGIATLQRVRDAKHGALDTSVVAELDSVIAQLQLAVCEAVDGDVKLGPLAQRALQVIGHVAETAVAEIVKAWLGKP